MIRRQTIKIIIVGSAIDKTFSAMTTRVQVLSRGVQMSIRKSKATDRVS